jgi:hypothetical protein
MNTESPPYPHEMFAIWRIGFNRLVLIDPVRANLLDHARRRSSSVPVSSEIPHKLGSNRSADRDHNNNNYRDYPFQYSTYSRTCRNQIPRRTTSRDVPPNAGLQRPGDNYARRKLWMRGTLIPVRCKRLFGSAWREDFFNRASETLQRPHRLQHLEQENQLGQYARRQSETNQTPSMNNQNAARSHS